MLWVGSPVWTWSQSDVHRGPVPSEVLREGRGRGLAVQEHLWPLMTGLYSIPSLPGARGLLSPDNRAFIMCHMGLWYPVGSGLHSPLLYTSLRR